MTYPNTAGYTEPTTSKAAADAIDSKGRADTIRDKVVGYLRYEYEASTEEIADRIDESYVSVQPRISELRAKGLIESTGKTVKGRFGRAISVWRLV